MIEKETLFIVIDSIERLVIKLDGYVLFYEFFSYHFNLLVFDRALFDLDPWGGEELKFERYNK